MDLQELDTPRPKTRWIKLHGHLEGVELLVRLASPKDGRRFHNKLVRAGIVKDTRENPFDVATGREADFFRELAAMYVLDWRGDIKLLKCRIGVASLQHASNSSLNSPVAQYHEPR